MRKFFGGLLLIEAAALALSMIGNEVEAGLWCCLAISVALGLFLLLKKPPSQEQLERKAAAEAEKEQQRIQRQADRQKLKERQSRMVLGEHMTGLPLAQGVVCSVLFNDDHVVISGSGHEFRLAYNKITDLQMVSNVEIQKSYVSSVGGAVGGALMFGTLGAMVGGRAKERTSNVTEYYFVITYNSNDEIEFISMHIADTLKANKVISRYRPRLSGAAKVVNL